MEYRIEEEADVEAPGSDPTDRADPAPSAGSEPRPGGRGPDRAAPAPGVTPARFEDEIEEISLLELVNVVLKRWKLVVGLPLLAALLAAAVSLVIPEKYAATTTFVPESEGESLSLPSGLSGLASQFGVSLPSTGGGSPQFYANVLRSRTLRDAVLRAGFPDPRTETVGDSATLLELLDVDGETEARRLEAGREQLSEITSLNVDNETSVVQVSVETRYPALSASVANLYVELLNRFNLETRQSQAQARRRFIEDRLTEAEAELRAAEEELRGFLESNRQFTGSPQLEFEHERLQRQVRIKEEVFTSLRRQYEEARIQEVNDTPVITVIDVAVPPQEKSSPRRKLNVLLAFFLVGVVAVFGAFGLEFIERSRERDEDEYREFTSRWSAIGRELRSLLRWRGRARGERGRPE